MAIKPKREKMTARQRKKFRIRKRVEGSEERPRITVFRSGKHIYAQAICDVTGKTLASASTLEKDLLSNASSVDRDGLPGNSTSSKSTAAAKAVGVALGKRCLEKNISGAVFDRNGWKYAGRVKALGDGVREAGLKL